MDFFEHQAQARKRTRELVVLYGLAVCAIIVAIYAMMIAGFQMSGEEVPRTYWDAELFIAVALGIGVLVGAGTAYKIHSLSGGGKAVADMLGGKRIDPGTIDPEERRLLNVVEEIAIASGVPVPPVYIMEEPSINAFAAGFTPSDAVIGVTRGCIQQLNRDELQGVVAHEFSHILHGDMRLNIRLIGVLFGILLINLLGQMVMRITFFSGGGRRRSRDSKDSGGLVVAMMLFSLGLIIVGSIGVFFGRLIKSAVSRQREFLADASAVQFTRNPAGIAGALKKIAGASTGSRVSNVHAEEAGHLFFANGLRSSLLGMMATHPPLEERIRRIEQGFAEGKAVRTGVSAGGARTSGGAEGLVSGFAGGAAVAPGDLAIGAPDARHMAYVGTLMASIPEVIRTSLRTLPGAQAIVFNLLLSGEKTVLQQQRKLLETAVGKDVLGRMRELARGVSALPPAARLPMIELALPALQTMNEADYPAFRACVDGLVAADGRISIFEYALSRMLIRHLDPGFGKATDSSVRYRSLEPVLSQVVPLVALLARFGNEDDESQAEADYLKGLAVLGVEPPPMPVPPDDPVQLFDQALTVLAQASLKLKKTILTACATAITANGNVTTEEAELLRASADALGCPMPPIMC